MAAQTLHTEVPRVSWDNFIAYWHNDFRQGEHVSLIGPTGTGKTTLGLELLAPRKYVCALATKPTDNTMQRLIREQTYRKIKAWPPPPTAQRVVLWPPYRDDADEYNQAIQMGRALREGFRAGGWTFFADELWWLTKKLNLGRLLESVYTQGRSNGVTIVGGTQRPAHVTLLAYDQATHLFFWRDNDETNLRRIGGLGGLHSGLIRRTVASLPRHVALYVNTRTGTLAKVQAPKPKGR